MSVYRHRILREREEAAEARPEQFARDLRGDHDSPWSYGPWSLGIDPPNFRTIAEAESEREDH